MLDLIIQLFHILGINTRNSTCPTLRFCGNHVPEDYPRLETGYFKLQLGKQTVTCPGCPVCIRGGMSRGCNVL